MEHLGLIDFSTTSLFRTMMMVLVVEPDYLPNSDVYFSYVGPHFVARGCGRDYPP
jgi:hypothetical protein